MKADGGVSRTAPAMTEDGLRAEVVAVCHRLRRSALVVAMEGNISTRYCGAGGDLVLATPTMRDKGTLGAGDLARTDMDGRLVGAGPPPSSELPAHLAVYRARPDVCGIVHAHPPYATSFAVAGIPLDQPLLAEAVVDLGEVPVAPYGQPGRQELAATIGRLAAAGHDVMLMANHGAIALGRTVTEALYRMETLEHYAQIALLTRLLGRSRPLEPSQVAELLRAREEAERQRPAAGCPACAAEVGPDPTPSYRLSRAELLGLLEEAVRVVCYNEG